jgi:hypothetical protein
MILHIFLATNGRTLRSMTHAIKDRLMLSWVTSCICTNQRGHSEWWHPLSCHLLGQSSFFKVLFLTPDFGNAWIWYCIDDSACSMRTSWTMWGVCSIRVLQSSWVNQYQMDRFTHERVHVDVSGASNECVSWWFRYVSDWRTICNGKTCGP